MSWLGDLFGLDDDTKQVVHEIYLTQVYATELDYAERCAEEAATWEHDEEDHQTLRSESRGGYTEAYFAKNELQELGREVEEVREPDPWWKIW